MGTLQFFFVLGCMASIVSGQALDSYNIDPTLVSVSGLSSGGFMAGQLGVAYSGIFTAGFGVFAAGPYDCARDQYVSNCIANADPSIKSPISHMKYWSGDLIDSLDNLQHRKIYMEVGTADPTVGLSPMHRLRDQLAHFSDPAKTSFITTKGAGHTFPTDFDAPGNAPCKVGSQSPFISNCGYDGAGEVLKWIYGKLRPRNNGTLTGSLLTFNQTGILGAPGLAPTGYAFIPKACENGRGTCKLHVVLHGCRQDPSRINTTFITNTGYTKWADTNNIILLYPQTTSDIIPRVIWGGTFAANPNACWDWNGWYGADADLKSGVQMTAIVNQVKQLMGAH